MTSTAKLDSTAVERGFDEAMSLTWFCHSPRRGRPCGLCPPCSVALAHDLGHRIPAAGAWDLFRRRQIKLTRAAAQRWRALAHRVRSALVAAAGL